MTVTLEKPAQRARKASASRQGWAPRLKKYQLQWEAIFRKHGWANRPSADKKDLRHTILEDLFGNYNFNVSSASNAQWDCIFIAQKVLLARGILAWSRESGRAAVELGLCRRYIWNIEHAGYDVQDVEEYGAPEEYVAAVSEDKFGTRTWRDLDSKDLFMLFITIKNRVRKAARNGQFTPPFNRRRTRRRQLPVLRITDIYTAT